MQIRASIGHNQFQDFEVEDNIILQGKVKKDYWVDMDKNATISIYRVKGSPTMNNESSLRYIVVVKNKGETKMSYACGFDDIFPYLVPLTDITENGKSVSIEKVNVFECMDNSFFKVYDTVSIWFTRPIAIVKINLHDTVKTKKSVEYHFYLTKKATLPFWMVKITTVDMEQIKETPCRNRVDPHGNVKCMGTLMTSKEILELFYSLDLQYKPEDIELELW